MRKDEKKNTTDFTCKEVVSTEVSGKPFSQEKAETQQVRLLMKTACSFRRIGIFVCLYELKIPKARIKESIPKARIVREGGGPLATSSLRHLVDQMEAAIPSVAFESRSLSDLIVNQVVHIYFVNRAILWHVNEWLVSALEHHMAFLLTCQQKISMSDFTRFSGVLLCAYCVSLELRELYMVEDRYVVRRRKEREVAAGPQGKFAITAENFRHHYWFVSMFPTGKITLQS